MCSAIHEALATGAEDAFVECRLAAHERARGDAGGVGHEVLEAEVCGHDVARARRAELGGGEAGREEEEEEVVLRERRGVRDDRDRGLRPVRRGGIGV